MEWNEHDVGRLETDVAASIAVQEIIIEIERRYRASEPTNLDASHVGPIRDPARGIQRSERRSERANAVGTGLLHLSHDRDLVDPDIGDRDIELDAGIR